MQSRFELEKKAELAVATRTLFALTATVAVLFIALFAMVAVVAAQPVIEDETCVSGERSLRTFASGRTEPGLCTSAEGVYDMHTGERFPEKTVHEFRCGAKIDDPDFLTKMRDHVGILWRVYEKPRWSTNPNDPPRLGYWYVPTLTAFTTNLWCAVERNNWNFGIGSFEGAR